MTEFVKIVIQLHDNDRQNGSRELIKVAFVISNKSMYSSQKCGEGFGPVKGFIVHVSCDH